MEMHPIKVLFSFKEIMTPTVQQIPLHEIAAILACFCGSAIRMSVSFEILHCPSVTSKGRAKFIKLSSIADHFFKLIIPI